eukprot:gene27843-36683_t
MVNKDVSITWSNRQGVILTPITTGVWAAERPFLWNNIDVGGRSVIARMLDGSLVVHSPVEWTSELGEALSRLGGLPAIKPEISWAYELGGSTSIPESLSSNGIEYVHFDCEINPFTGRPFFNEVVFYHAKSKSFVMADVFWNYPGGENPNYSDHEDSDNETGTQHICSKAPTPLLPGGRLPAVQVPKGTMLWKLGMDKVYWPFYQRFMVGKRNDRREKYNDVVRKILSWDIEVIVPCHGDVIKGQQLCRRILTEHFANAKYS